MKRILYFFSFFAAALLASSCSEREMEYDSTRVIAAVFYSSFTKSEASYDPLTQKTSSLWQAGDVIWLSNGVSVESCTLAPADVTEGGAKALINTSLDGDVCAVYPYSAVSEPTVASLAPSLNIGSVQDGSFASADICAGRSSEDGIVFYNLCALVKFTVTSDEISSVSFMAAGKKLINGEVSLSFSEEGLPSVSSSASAGSYKASSTKVTSLSSGDVFYIAVAPDTCSTVTLAGYDSNGNYLFLRTNTGTSGSAASYPFSAGKIYDMGAVSSEHRGVTGGHSWAQLWEGSPKWADFNAGSSSNDYSLADGSSSSWGTSPWTEAVCGSSSGWRSVWNGGNFDSWDNILSSGTSSSGSWQVPTKAQLESLIDSGKTGLKWCDGSCSQFVAGCTLKGYKVSGVTDGYTSVSIFLPASGYYWAMFGEFENVGGSGHYWSSTPGTSTGIKLYFTTNKTPAFSETGEFEFFVRPVAL